MRLSAGDTVDRYEVEGALPRSADGERWMVRHVRLRTRAILEIGPDLPAVAAAARLEEVRARASVVHPQVVRVLDWLDVHGVPALIREHVDLPTLASCLSAGSLRPDEAHAVARLAVQLAAMAESAGVPAGAPAADQVWLGPSGPRMGVAAPGRSVGQLVDELLVALPDPELRSLRDRLDAADAGEVWNAVYGGPLAEMPLAVPPVSTWTSLGAMGARSAAGSVPRTLPSPRTPLIGRDQAVAAILGALDGVHPLVTVLGPGGVGKSRLAIEVARRWTAGPVLFVDLSAVTTAGAALASIGWALGSERDSIESVSALLGRLGPVLIVLDDVEQLVPALGAVVPEIRSRAPETRVLATSRTRLGLDREWSLTLDPLGVPSGPETLTTSDAWRLLEVVAPPGSLDQADPELLVALLRALEGLPLSVELAAARLEVLTPAALVGRLGGPAAEGRFALLRDPLEPGERHGSLYATIDASWSLLSPEEGRLLARLSAFAGTFPIDLALAVGGGDPAVLDGLVARSLAQRRGSRFALLDAIRAFADHRLGADEREGLIVDHATAIAAAVASVVAELPAGLRDTWRRMAELAMECAAIVDRAASRPALSEAALICTRLLAELALRRGPLQSVPERVDRALAMPGGPREPRVLLQILRARATRLLGRPDEAAAELQALLALPDLPPNYRATLHGHLSDTVTGPVSMVHGDAAAELASIHGPATLVATAHASVASGLLDAGRTEEAFARYDLALAAVVRGDRLTEMEIRKRIGWARLIVDDLAAAEPHLVRARQLASEIDDRRTVAVTTGQLALCADASGQSGPAEALYADAHRLLEALGDRVMAAFYGGSLGRLWLQSGRWADGIAKLEASRVDIDEQSYAALRTALAIALARTGRKDALLVVPHDSADLVATLAAAADAAARGSRIEAKTALDAVTRAATTLGDVLTQAVADRAVDELADGLDAWWVAADGGWLEAPDGKRSADRVPAANARILVRLARERVDDPGRSVEPVALVAAGWPGERLVPRAATNRLQVALTGLRKIGLEPLLLRQRGGWLLDPGSPLRIVP